MNKEKLRYYIYPVELYNLLGKKEHVLSIIYIYNNYDIYLSKISSFNTSFGIKIISVLIFFITLILSLLYIISLTLNILAKYIVIPIKNVNYMLKGINIGEDNRLEYLKHLKKRQDDNLEKLEKLYIFEDKRFNNISSEELSNNNIIKDNSTEVKENLNLIERNEENVNISNDWNNIYDKESNNIENEYKFYDFDEALLQYCHLEVDYIIKLLLDFKGAYLLTSSDQNIEQIVDYSYSENIFKNHKNIIRAGICQSNIGNLYIRLLKFDKAIYHLAISLQDKKLQKFLRQSLNDELDENNTLINQIHNFFNTEKINEKNNILITKQQNNGSDKLSQKIIGIFINTRYCRLIYTYYKFFKDMKKLQKLEKNNNERINGQFMNTNFHNINYYHKIIIQYIYLSLVKKIL